MYIQNNNDTVSNHLKFIYLHTLKVACMWVLMSYIGIADGYLCNCKYISTAPNTTVQTRV